ncbi:hypothetical protein, partial [Ollibium composti]|uniref:hypothetical protein n=1 Tax=Ollibium composti TaxID=2675109 RepID=UPI0019815EF5
APILHQSHRLELELAAELPSLHSNSPVPLNTLSRCPRNRQQANNNELEEFDLIYRSGRVKMGMGAGLDLILPEEMKLLERLAGLGATS